MNGFTIYVFECASKIWMLMTDYRGSCTKVSWPCGVQTEGSDFKGTYYPCFGGCDS